MKKGLFLLLAISALGWAELGVVKPQDWNDHLEKMLNKSGMRQRVERLSISQSEREIEIDTQMTLIDDIEGHSITVDFKTFFRPGTFRTYRTSEMHLSVQGNFLPFTTYTSVSRRMLMGLKLLLTGSKDAELFESLDNWREGKRPLRIYSEGRYQARTHEHSYGKKWDSLKASAANMIGMYKRGENGKLTAALNMLVLSQLDVRPVYVQSNCATKYMFPHSVVEAMSLFK